MPSVSQPVQKKYYNRPKFLQAPDPSTLATPPGSIRSGWHDVEPFATHQYSPFIMIHPSSRDDRFPAPSVLADIERMEPDMPPGLVAKRAYTFGRNTHGNTTLIPTIQTGWSALYSPIMRPTKRSREDFFVDSIPLTNCPVQKRLRIAANESVSFAKWCTDYLITVLTKTGFHHNISATTYNKLWTNIIRLLWDLGLSESVVLLAFWYIRRLFPDGFMHPSVFSRSEGGTIAWRIYLLGIMIAEKWLEDSAYGLRNWQSYFELPSNCIKALERSFLGLLDYDINISNGQWQTWIGSLQSHCQAELLAGHFEELRYSIMEILRQLLTNCRALPTERDKQELFNKPKNEPSPLVLQLLEPYSLDEGLEFTRTPLLLQKRTYSTAWNPAADPIVTAKPRSSGIAPIARPTALSLATSGNCHNRPFLRTPVGPFVDGFLVPIMI